MTKDQEKNLQDIQQRRMQQSRGLIAKMPRKMFLQGIAKALHVEISPESKWHRLFPCTSDILKTEGKRIKDILEYTE